jgi:NifU-like protein involved in Fe-S cluster formation
MARFSQKVLEYFEDPRNSGGMLNADRVGTASGPGGAPNVTLFLRLSGNRVVQATFEAAGCGVTIAAASVLTELVMEQELAVCATFTVQHIIDALEGLPADKHYCAVIAISALQQAIGIGEKPGGVGTR